MNMMPLLESRALHTLHLIGKSYSEAFKDDDVKEGDRMPPLQELVLQHYCWDHSPEVALNFWNWTKLVHLELRDVCVLRFLRTVPPQHLIQLRTLVLDPRCKYTEQPETSDLILVLLKKVNHLEKLYLRCIIPKVLPGILEQGGSLLSLELRDTFGTRFSVLSIGEMDSILSSCVHLMELGIQLHFRPRGKQVGELDIKSDVIPCMRNARRLKLFVCCWTRDLPRAENKDFAEIHTAVRNWLSWLLHCKKGAPLEIVVFEMKILGHKQGQNNERTLSSTILTWTYDIRKGPFLRKPVISLQY